MSDRKAQMSLEYIAKMLIIVVVIAVVIGMMYTFREQIVEKWRCILNPECDIPVVEINPVFVPGSFTASDFANFIETCWAETRDAKDSKVCFVLSGLYTDPSGTAENDIKNLLDSKIRNNVVFGADFSKDFFSVNYEIIGNEIHLKSGTR